MSTPPRPPSSVPALWAVFRLSVKQGLAQRASWIPRAVFYGLLVLIFSRLWLAVDVSGVLPGVTSRDMLWYLAVTEWIVLSLPLAHLAVEDDWRSGDLAALLPRPVPWLATKIVEGLGGLFVRLLVLGVTGFAITWLLAGGLPRDPRGLLLAIPLGFVAGLFGTLCYAWVGLTVVWLGDSSPVFWVFQKLCFVLGGLILPLSMYPGWLRTVAEQSPFGAFLNGPAKLALAYDPGSALDTGLRLLGWSALAVLGLMGTWSRARRRLDVSGG